MAINKIAYQVLEENQENYINILRGGQSVTDTGWNTYADSPGVNPVDGIGGTASITWSQNTVSPLSGDSDLRLVKGATNRQGDGVSIPFTISNRHLAKVLQISFDAELISGNYESPIITSTIGTYSITSTTCTITAPHAFIAGQIVNMIFTSGSPPVNGFYTITSVTATTFVFTVASGSSTGNCSYTVPADLRISIIQDPTGTPVVLEPVNTGIQLGIINQRIRHIANFQTHLSITSYRLCIHVSNASTAAYTVDFNNFKVWEQQQSLGAVITDWASYTPTLISFGTTTNQDFQWRRVGGNMEIQGKWTAGTATGVEARIPLPFGTIDSTRIPNIRIVGNAAYNASAAGYFGTYILAEPSVTYLTMGIQTSTGNALTKVNGSTMGNNTYTMFASVPLSGWGSNVAMSSDTGDGRVVAARYYQPTAATASSSIPFRFTIRDYDTHNAVSIGTSGSSTDIWKFTAPISGYYRISTVLYSTSITWVYKNGSNSGNYAILGGNVNDYLSGSISVFLNSGEFVDLRPTNSFTAGANGLQSISIERISIGSQIIATQETVSASAYIGGANQTTTGGTIINFNTKWHDTHNAVTTGASWRFTAPMNGKYQISGYLAMSNVSQRTELRKNGSTFLFGLTRQPAGSNYGANFSVTLDLISSDFIDLRSTTSTDYYGGNPASTGEPCYISINRIGI